MKTRAFAVPYSKYLETRVTPISKEENKLNKQYFGEIVQALLPGVEILNHRFPKLFDEGQIFNFDLETLPGFLLFLVTGNYRNGEEVSYAYTDKSLNAEMLASYGTATLNNMQNALILSLPKEVFGLGTSRSKSRLCQKAYCFPYAGGEGSGLLQYVLSRVVNFKTSLYNYYRINFLSEEMASKDLAITSLVENGYISFYNEISTVLEINELIEYVESLKRSRSEDEKDFRDMKHMFVKKDYTKYTHDQLLDRMNALIAAIDEKAILKLQIILNGSRTEELLMATIDYELSNNLYV